MNAQSAYLIIAGATAFCAGYAAVTTLAANAVQRGRASRAYGQAVSAGRVDSLLRNGFRLFAPLAERLVRVPPIRKWAVSLSEAAAMKGRESNPRAICSLALGTFPALVAAGFAAGSWACAVALPCAAVMLVTAMGNRLREKRQELLRDQLPDALRAMSACFHAGLSLSQTLEQLVHEVPAPLGTVFEAAVAQIRTGASVGQALEAMRRQSGLAELAFLSVALQVQHQAGGSMQSVLDATGDALEGELELKRSLRVQTAQARLSARVVVGVTVLLVIVLSMLSRDFLAVFFQSTAGVVMLSVAVCMQLAGIVFVRRLLNVQVD